MNHHPDKKKSSDRKKALIICLAIFLPLILLGGAYTKWVYDYNVEVQKQEQARAAEAARLAADPINNNNLFIALNKSRSSTAAQPLQTVANLNSAADMFCKDMIASKYFDYTNPTSGKTANSFITDAQGDLYYVNYVSSIGSGYSTTQTASDVIAGLMTSQATNLADNKFDSVGLAVCPFVDSEFLAAGDNLIVITLANVDAKPVAQAPVYTAPRYTAPAYRAPSSFHCNSYSYSFNNSTSTSCYSY